MNLTASPSRRKPACVHALAIEQWPAPDRAAWQAACRPGARLSKGGAASHLKPIIQQDLARRYSYFLNFLCEAGLLDPDAQAAAQVQPHPVAQYVRHLQAGVGSVTVHGSIRKLRRTARILAPSRDFHWLGEIEQDLALLATPRSKASRLVLSDIIVEAGLTLCAEAEQRSGNRDLRRAMQFRDGLMLALLAMHPIRLKNFASLTFGRNFIERDGAWWIALSARETKEGRVDDRCVDPLLMSALDQYLTIHRPKLLRGARSEMLWIGLYGEPMTYSAVAAGITHRSLETLGIPLSPHLFRTSGASYSATYAGQLPHLASALLHHRDPRITQAHYNRATSISAGNALGEVIKRYV